MNSVYHDVEIELDENVSGDAEIRILRSPHDRPRASFNLSEERKQALEEKVKNFSKALLKEEQGPERRRLAEEIGLELHEILLPGDIGRTVKSSTDSLREEERESLRLRLSFGKDYDHQLGGLPWELICHPQTRRFLANDDRYSFARYLDYGERIQTLHVKARMKVLAVLPSPDSPNVGYIDREKHGQFLTDIFDPSDHLEINFLHKKSGKGRATLAALREELNEAQTEGYPYHAVHILCHGGFNEDNEGVLLFEREDGSEHLITGRLLAQRLSSSVRLIVLASCSTGKVPIPRYGSKHPFSGVASALIAAGKPAVVAMQFTVSEQAVVAFAEGFYEKIDQNEPLDAAITYGRQAIEDKGDEDSYEWATPVLFLRSFDGKVLELDNGGIPPRKVAIFNVLDHGSAEMRHADYTIDLTKYFDDRTIRRPEDWNGIIFSKLQDKLGKLSQRRSIHLELAVPLSIAFTVGHLLPIKDRRSITLRQRKAIWDFSDPGIRQPTWLPKESLTDDVKQLRNFSLVPGSREIAVVVEAGPSIWQDVYNYLRLGKFQPPNVENIVYAQLENADHFIIDCGGLAQQLAIDLVERVREQIRKCDGRKVHLFFRGPAGLAVALGRLSHTWGPVQLYEFDFERGEHGSYTPSILLEPTMSQR